MCWGPTSYLVIDIGGSKVHSRLMTCGQSHMLGKGQGQFFADRQPRWENQVLNRKSKVIRDDKRKKKRKFL